MAPALSLFSAEREKIDIVVNCLGLDIGGANLKAADCSGLARSVPFPLWQAPEQLPFELQRLLVDFPEVDTFAVTMTGELADCFATKAEGVERILAGVETVAGSRPIRVWSTDGCFVSDKEACRNPLLVAAANWHAVATWWGQTRQIAAGVLIDIGSTTTDVIPVRGEKPATQGLTDVTRLQAGELLYTGAVRTPLCAIVREVPFRGAMTPVAAEWFSTSLDLGLLLGEIDEDPHCRETANQRPATREAAWDRVARQICCDRSECPFEEAVAIARSVRDQQLRQIRESLEKVLARHGKGVLQEILISGSGRFLARQVLSMLPELQSAAVVDLGELLSPELAGAACAHAVAALCQGMGGRS